MKKTSKNPIKEFAKTISKDSKLFRKQLEEVKGKYPLVMLAYRIQQAMITELSMPGFTMDTEIGSLYTVIKIDRDSIIRLKVEMQRRIRDLKKCLVRAQASGSRGEKYLAGMECFGAYASGRRR